MKPVLAPGSHVHDFKPKEQKVPLYKADARAKERSYINGKDTLKMLACSCGVIYTVDLERLTT